MGTGYHVILILFTFALYVTGSIVFTVGIYNDAKGHYNRNPLMWALLFILVSFLSIIAYFCTRKDNIMTVGCPQCRRILPEPMGQCPFCGQATNLPPEEPAFIAWRRKGKRQMIWGGIFGGIGYVTFMIFYIMLLEARGV